MAEKKTESKTEPELDLRIFYKASGCPVSKVHLENPEHQALLEQAIAAPSISHAAISEVLWDKWQVQLTGDSIGRHRAYPQKCSCKNIPK